MAPFEWDNDLAVLKTIINAGENSFTLRMGEKDGKICVLFESGGFRKSFLPELRASVRRILSLEFDMKEFLENCRIHSPKLLPWVKKGFGRMLRCGSPWEDAVKTLCTTNASWGFTQQMCRRLCEEIGQSGAFPTTQQVLEAGEKKLKTIKLGYRARYLMKLADDVSEKKINFALIEKGACSYESAHRQVKSLLGFGEYAQQHLLVLLGWHHSLPIDREVSKYLRQSKKRGRKNGLNGLYREWGVNRFTAYKVERIANKKNWIGD